MSRRLDPEEIDRQLGELPGWSGDGSALRRSASFPGFPAAIRAVDDIAVLAEAMDHHPDIDIRWRTLHLTLSTHSAGGVTQLDVELAHRIDEAVAHHGGT
jgi:4a-hydroxytetrahydrobiopterin dehydratase